jgi:sec-independent protein translocase protein TatA
MQPVLAFLPSLGPPEMIVVGVIAVLLFGKRLPEVGRSLGKGIVEFKKGIRGIEDEFMSSTSTPSTSKPATVHSDFDHSSDPPVAAIPKFEPPTSPPTSSPELSSAPSYQD